MRATTDLHGLTGAYVVDALDDVERARFERHLVDCADCAAEVSSLRATVVGLSAVVAATPPTALRVATLERIATVRPQPPRTRPSRRRLGRRSGVVLVAAAIAVLMVAGGLLWRAGDHRRPAPSAQQVLAAADAHRQTLTFPDGSRATLISSRSVDRAVLQTQRMAAPPAGMAYELWFRRSGNFSAAGIMPPIGDQTFLLHGRVAHADWVGITVEPRAGSTQPTSTPIASFELSAR